MIKGVVFDFGGVMTTTTMPERVKALVAKLGIPWSVFETGFEKYRRQMDGDLMTIDEMYDRTLADAHLTLSPDVRARIIEEDQASFLYRNEATREWMKGLRARGFKIGILTNMYSDFARRFRVAFADFIALADALVVSGEVHLYKPQREIYDLLRERIGLPAEELCFFDDVEANCAGARAAGWQAIRFTTTAATASAFEELLKA